MTDVMKSTRLNLTLITKHYHIVYYKIFGQLVVTALIINLIVLVKLMNGVPDCTQTLHCKCYGQLCKI